MDNGYRAITKDECAFVEAGDQAKSILMDWHNISAEDIGTSYHEYDFNHWEYRRPIAQDHYATPTDKIVEHALDATSNAPDEWPSETGEWVNGLPPVGLECNVRYRGQSFWTNWAKGCFKAGHDSKIWIQYAMENLVLPAHDVEFSPILTPAQAEEREREEAKKQLAGLLQKNDQDVTDLCNRSISYFMPLAEFLLDNGCQLKDKSDD